MGLRHPTIVIQSAEQSESCSGSVDSSNSYRAVEGNHGARRDSLEHFVERKDLRPVRLVVRGGLVVDGSYRGLQLVRTDDCRAKGARDERNPLGNLRGVPLPTLVPRTVPSGSVTCT